MSISPASVVFGVAAIASLGMAVKQTASGDVRTLEADGIAAAVAAEAVESDDLTYVDVDELPGAGDSDEQPAGLSVAERAAIATARDAALPKLVGRTVGSPGPLLDGIEIGVHANGWSDASAALTPGGLSLTTDGSYAPRVVISDRDDPTTCQLVSKLFTDAWGAPTAEAGVWWDADTGHRAAVVTEADGRDEGELCDIVFDRALTGERWAELILATGKPKLSMVSVRDGLAARHAENVEQPAPNQYSWSERGLGVGTGRTSVVVDAPESDDPTAPRLGGAEARGQSASLVAGLYATVITDETSARAAMARLREHLGTPATTEPERMIWTGRRPASVMWDGNSLAVGLGTLANAAGVGGE